MNRYGMGLVLLTMVLLRAVAGETSTVPAGAGAMAPHLAAAPGGPMVLSWLEPDGERHALRYATWDGERWGAAATVTAGTDWFVNWADFPSVVPVNDSLWAAHWLRRSGDSTYAYDVVLAVSTDAGKTWASPLVPHTDGTPTEHGFVSLFPQGNGVGAVWLDGRNTSGHDHGGSMTLRYAKLNAESQVSEGYLMDGQVCDCCQTDVAIAQSGPVAVYRDRSDGEIRDIAIMRMIDGRWHEPALVANDGWEIAGCPVNGPAVAASGHQVAVAWFTQADGQSQVKVARSDNSGADFSVVALIDGQAPLGRVDVAFDGHGTAWVLWMREAQDGQAQLVLRPVQPDGRIGSEIVLAENSAARPAGFPQLAISGSEAMVVWTDAREVPTRLGASRWTLPDPS